MITITKPLGLDFTIKWIQASAEISPAQEIAITQSLQWLYEQICLVLHDLTKKQDGKGRPSDILKQKTPGKTPTNTTSSKKLPSAWERRQQSKWRKYSLYGDSRHNVYTCGLRVYFSAPIMKVKMAVSTLMIASTPMITSIPMIASTPMIVSTLTIVSIPTIVSILPIASIPSIISTPVSSPELELLYFKPAPLHKYHDADKPFESGFFSSYTTITLINTNSTCSFQAISHTIYGSKDSCRLVRQLMEI